MTRRACTTLALGLVATATLATATAHAEGCPPAAQQRLAGDFAGAEAAARACLAAAPEDVVVWFELSRAIGYAGRHAEALGWVERGLDRYPDDTDLGLWRVRLLAWIGRYVEAREAFTEIALRVPAVLTDRETAMLGVDVAFWAKDWGRAAGGFTRYLATWPDDADALRKRGITYIEQGLDRQAVDDLDASCRLAGPSGAACAMREDIRRRASRVSLRLEPTIATDGTVDEVRTTVEVMVRTWDELRVGLAGELRHRAAPEESADDALATLLATYRAERWSAEGGLGIGFAPTFSPDLSAWVEAGVALADPLWAHVRYWRLSFPDAGAHVVSPSLDLYVGPVELDLRYWLGLPDGGDATHTGLLRARWDLSSHVTAEVGVGAGTAGDYLVVSAIPADGHLLGLAGLAWSPSWRHRVHAGYVVRREEAPGSILFRHEIALSYELRL